MENEDEVIKKAGFILSWMLILFIGLGLSYGILLILKHIAGLFL